MPNIIAYLMLMAWPVVCVMLFKRLELERAIVWTILGGYLVMPPKTSLDLPLVPDFDKTSIPNLCALGFCILIAKRRIPLWPKSPTMRVLLTVFLLGTIPTVLTNRDPIFFQSMFDTEPVTFITGVLPGLRSIDLFSVMSSQLIILIPFILGRAFLASETGQKELLLALAVSALVYSIPAMFEVRMSPQLNIWIYGFFQHDFGQTFRQGGFRPIVFLPHPLWTAFYFMTALVSAAALSRHVDASLRPRFLAATVYLFAVLYFCKSLASLLYGLSLVPVVLLLTLRIQVRVAFTFALIAVTYPILRDYNLVPLDTLVDWAGAIDPLRAESLEYRFDNEEQLLARAHDRWLFGWGGWGRNLVRDLKSGEIVNIPDGEWIIVFGTFGWVGYLSKMGLLAAPIFLLWRSMRQHQPTVTNAALALILAITLVDMLINAALTPFTWLIAGAVTGHYENTLPGQATRHGKARGAGPVIS